MISSLRRWLKKLKDKYTIFSLLYNKVYVSFLTWKRHNVKLYKWGEGNLIKIPSKTYCDNLVIIIKGNNNRLKIGEKCIFKNTNEIFIEGNDNKVVIGDNVTFDQNVGLVCCEGTELSIGSNCIFANGVRVRTSDQHAIFDENNRRINHAKNVIIGNHVWLGASVIVMKGSNIGDGTVVGLNSMVFGTVPNNSIAVGRPAKIVKSNICWTE